MGIFIIISIMKAISKMIWLGLLVIFAFTACSKNTPSGPSQMNEGTIYFVNHSRYALRLTTFMQTHNGQLRTQQLNVPIFINASYQLHNLFNGSTIFPGGDQVTIGFASQATDPNNPNAPLFSENVVFTVNGLAIVKVINAGEYEISGR
jgi:hypothetical protein